ncbi:hypothetical protein [Streptomyces chartreusis]|jgi:hypothetical protein|uniref:hypothetical protein n=1 Tax=Streptomyces chartreusis TaxID=1969 RepID=UPI00386F5C31|nr:hypothetical protein OG938_19830 [Streptomyces chartreusis]WTA29145.1 hypothetical protein OIA45_25395 [Streptomyces chartreusis]
MANAVSQTLTAPGFWFERIRYTSSRDTIVFSADYQATTHPAPALRRIRIEVRALVSGLPTPEMFRAFEWVDGDGYISAGAALRRGEPCSFSISTHDERIDWTVRPVTLLTLASSDPFDGCPREKRHSLAGYLTLLPLAP